MKTTERLNWIERNYYHVILSFLVALALFITFGCNTTKGMQRRSHKAQVELVGQMNN